jgi:hypothetical protein
MNGSQTLNYSNTLTSEKNNNSNSESLLDFDFAMCHSCYSCWH